MSKTSDKPLALGVTLTHEIIERLQFLTKTSLDMATLVPPVAAIIDPVLEVDRLMFKSIRGLADQHKNVSTEPDPIDTICEIRALADQAIHKLEHGSEGSGDVEDESAREVPDA